ncbi:hypothetical protein DICVIV_01074 [Dictyocaulus viviparus]|uniref:Uncharacterized protein n=1 Tax=Dictyocaulus viviparus TaxID=29172 RepID=A0A0D8Y7P4_DICVI|nr:hypothetical protein DICVIV_01074 [Dictyocaulus viviparus]
MMKLLFKISLTFSLSVLLMFIAFGNFDDNSGAPTVNRARRRVSERNLVSSYVHGVGHCLRVKTRVGGAQQTRKSQEERNTNDVGMT